MESEDRDTDAPHHSTMTATSPTDSGRWLLPVLAPFAVVIGAHLVWDSSAGGAVLGSLATGALWGGVLIIGLIVLVLVAVSTTAMKSQSRSHASPGTTVAPAVGPRWRPVTAAAVFILLTSVAARLTPLPLFDAFERAWQGKVIDLLWVLLLYVVFRRWARDEAGFRWTLAPGTGRPAFTLIAGTFCFFVALTLVAVATGSAPAQTPSIEQFVFDATIPNLTEELIWRGAMLAVLCRAFPPMRMVAGAPVGWAIVISSVVFGLGHTILIDATGVWSVSIAGGLFATAMGLLLGWVWARTGSIWPAFLLHCAPELGLDVGMALMG